MSPLYEPWPTCRSCTEPTCHACYDEATYDDNDGRPLVTCRDCVAFNEDPRERDEDNGSQYGDPRDEMDDRLLAD